jgi:CBS domain-containing protein
MAAMFAGASRALLASVVFAFETTRQPMSLLPLLGGCTAAYLASMLSMRHSIMTEKIARRGVRVVSEYTADFLGQVLVSEVATAPVVLLHGDDSCDRVRAWIHGGGAGASHQGFPVVDAGERLIGVLTRRDLLGDGAIGGDRPLRDLVSRRPAVVFGDSSLREASDHMAREHVGRLPVVSRTDPTRVVGILTRSDLIAIHSRRLDAEHRGEPRYTLRGRQDAGRAQKVQTGQTAPS